MDSDELIDILNRDLRVEYSLVIRYMVIASQLDHVEEKDVLDALIKLSIESVSHSRFVAEAIRELGGMPTTELTPFTYDPDLREVLRASIEIETRTREDYEKAEVEVGPGPLAKMLKRLCSDETRHISILTELHDNLEVVQD